MNKFKDDLIDQFYTEGAFWVQFNYIGRFIPWKIHIYADNEKDLRAILNEALPTLIMNNIAHKFAIPSKLEELNSSPQKGKAITIYPPDRKMLRFLLFKLDELFQTKLSISRSEIIGDRKYGRSGRLFYRYELCSGEYNDMVFDFRKQEMREAYNLWYQPNRGGNHYLASDMSEEDDPILNIKKNPAKYFVLIHHKYTERINPLYGLPDSVDFSDKTKGIENLNVMYEYLHRTLKNENVICIPVYSYTDNYQDYLRKELGVYW